MLCAMCSEPCAWAKGVVPSGVESKGKGLSAQFGKGERSMISVSIGAVIVIVAIV